jgi:hypothetical protein
MDEVPSAEPMAMSAPPMSTDTDGLGSIEVVPDDSPMDLKLDDEEEESVDDESQNKSVHVNITVEGKRNYLLRHRAVRLVKALSETKSRVHRNKIRKELKVLREALIITENSQNLRLAKNIKVILKESTMRRRNRNWLFEGKDGAGGEEVEFDDAGFEEGDVDVDAIKDAVADLASAVGMDGSATASLIASTSTSPSSKPASSNSTSSPPAPSFPSNSQFLLRRLIVLSFKITFMFFANLKFWLFSVIISASRKTFNSFRILFR